MLCCCTAQPQGIFRPGLREWVSNSHGQDILLIAQLQNIGGTQRLTTRASIIISGLHPVHVSFLIVVRYIPVCWKQPHFTQMEPVGNEQERAPHHTYPSTSRFKQQPDARSPSLATLATASQVLSAIGAVVMMMMTSILGHLVTGIIPSGEGLEGLAKRERTTATASCRCERSLETCHRLFLDCCSLALETQRTYDRSMWTHMGCSAW